MEEIGSEGMDWMHLAQVRNQWRALTNTAMNHRIPQKAGNLTSWVTVSFWRKALPHGVSCFVSSLGTVCSNTRPAPHCWPRVVGLQACLVRSQATQQRIAYQSPDASSRKEIAYTCWVNFPRTMDSVVLQEPVLCVTAWIALCHEPVPKRGLRTSDAQRLTVTLKSWLGRTGAIKSTVCTNQGLPPLDWCSAVQRVRCWIRRLITIMNTKNKQWNFIVSHLTPTPPLELRSILILSSNLQSILLDEARAT
jgi:hypothetical protein